MTLHAIRTSYDPKGRFADILFSNSGLQQEITQLGYAVRDCLTAHEVGKLLQGYGELVSELPSGLPDSFFPSGRIENPRLRNKAREVVDLHVPRAIDHFFADGAYTMDGGTILIKPVGHSTALSPHQDSSHVDESRHFSVYAWIPLTDTTDVNGALHVLPRSHLLGNRHRSLNVPWAFAGMEQMILPDMVSLPMRAGQVCFFEGALIHSSPPNLSDSVRVAVNYLIRPSDSTFLHHFVDGDTPEGMVEVYGVSLDFFYNEDFESRPPAHLLLGHEKAVNAPACRETLRSLIGR
jgi:hypothetical protein